MKSRTASATSSGCSSKSIWLQHVYIQVPATLQASEAPALLVQSRGGESALVNYRVRLPYYVVDRLFDTAVLIVGVGRHQDRVTIQRKADGQ